MKDTSDFYNKYWKNRSASHKLYYPEDHWKPSRFRIALRMVKECYTGDKLSILDIGCGDGTLGKLIKDELKDDAYILGVDTSEESVKHASKFYDKAIRVNVEDQNIVDSVEYRKFDIVISLEVLEHLFDPFSLVQSCKHLLDRQGNLITSFPNIAWWKYRVDLLCGDFPIGYTVFDPAEHIQNFTLKSFLSLLNKAGFSKQEVCADLVYPRFLKHLGRLLRRYPSLFGQQIVVKARHSID